MPARAPRRSFGTPLVITLAAVPACYIAPAAPPQPPAPVATEPAPQPPPATPPPPSQPPDYQSPSISPSPVIANPPPPQPRPPMQEQASWTVFKTKTGCMAAIKVACPTGEPGKPMPTCNPPPAFAYDCPPGISLDKPITIVTFGDSCAVEPEPIHCPPHAACNPPRPRTVTCPKP